MCFFSELQKRVENGMDVSLRYFSWNKAEKNYHSIYDYALRSRWCNWFGSHGMGRATERAGTTEEPKDDESSTSASLEFSIKEQESETESVVELKGPDYNDQSKPSRMNGILNNSVQINGKPREATPEKNGVRKAPVQDSSQSQGNSDKGSSENEEEEGGGGSGEKKSTQSREKSKAARRFFPQNIFKPNGSAQAGFLQNGSIQNSLKNGFPGLNNSKQGNSAQNQSAESSLGSNNSSLAPTSPPVQQPALWPTPPQSSSAIFNR